LVTEILWRRYCIGWLVVFYSAEIGKILLL
jgi:hypothetical protein